MVVLTGEGAKGTFPDRFAYCHGMKFFTRLILPCTRYLRARNIERYIGAGVERLLDIGCGDGYFLKRSRVKERHGLDELMGDRIEDLDRLPEGHFDCVTMLAVIEHIADPKAFLRPVQRVIRPGGRLLMTTPKRAAHGLIGLYVSGIDEEHKHYYDRESLRAVLAGEFELEAYHTFIFGLNQAFSFVKKTAPA